jgi:hypothetical protein
MTCRQQPPSSTTVWMCPWMRSAWTCLLQGKALTFLPL